MTDVAFHTGVPDKLGYACRLLRKASRQGVRTAVVGDASLLTQLDQALWVFEHEEFVPHLRLRAGAAPDARNHRTPIWLLDDEQTAVDATLLVNLGPPFPLQPDRFARVIEVVSVGGDDVQAGRDRWKQYLACGLKPVNLPYRASPESVPAN